MLDLTRLKIFLSTAENLSFSEAAHQLHLSQPTVSHHIKGLERDLGVALFDRSTHKVKLTEAGRLMYPRVKKLIRDTVEIHQMVESTQDKILGSLRIACSTTTGKYILPQFAARFHERHPGVRIAILRCTSSFVMPQLLEEEANLGVVSFEASDGELESQDFFNDHIVLITPSNHPWAKRDAIEPSELIGQQIIHREPESGTSRVLAIELARHDISLEDMDTVLELGNAEAIVTTVAAGHGISFVSRIAATCQLEHGLVSEVSVNDLSLYRKIFMVRKKLHPANRAMEAFWGFVHEPTNRDLLQIAEA